MRRIHQLLTQEAEVKKLWLTTATQTYHNLQKADLFEGHVRTFQPKADTEEAMPAEERKVQCIAEDMLAALHKVTADLLNVTAAKDRTNCEAFADVVVNGEKLLEKVPVSFLIFLEKRLVDLRTNLAKCAVLSADKNWTFDSQSRLHKTAEERQQRKVKKQVAITLAQATDKHPAQTQLITEDVYVGDFVGVKMSGAMSPAKQKQLLDKLQLLIEAVKSARQEANMTAVKEETILGKKVMDFILG